MTPAESPSWAPAPAAAGSSRVPHRLLPSRALPRRGCAAGREGAGASWGTTSGRGPKQGIAHVLGARTAEKDGLCWQSSPASAAIPLKYMASPTRASCRNPAADLAAACCRLLPLAAAAAAARSPQPAMPSCAASGADVLVAAPRLNAALHSCCMLRAAMATGWTRTLKSLFPCRRPGDGAKLKSWANGGWQRCWLGKVQRPCGRRSARIDG